jgi:hypothetical protein
MRGLLDEIDREATSQKQALEALLEAPDQPAPTPAKRPRKSPSEDVA